LPEAELHACCSHMHSCTSACAAAEPEGGDGGKADQAEVSEPTGGGGGGGELAGGDEAVAVTQLHRQVRQLAAQP